MKKYIIVLIAEDKPIEDEEYLSIYEIEDKIISRDLDAGLSVKILSIKELEDIL